MATEPGKFVYTGEFISELAWRTGLSLTEAKAVTTAVFGILEDRMRCNQPVVLDGFGTFEVRQTTERVGRNPKTMEEHTIPAGYRPVFKPTRSSWSPSPGPSRRERSRSRSSAWCSTGMDTAGPGGDVPRRKCRPPAGTASRIRRRKSPMRIRERRRKTPCLPALLYEP